MTGATSVQFMVHLQIVCGLGSAVVLEFLLYYVTKLEYQLEIREAIYLDSMLDLF